jgi:pimeloyl-ACP methyl ester carboxylesterase
MNAPSYWSGFSDVVSTEDFTMSVTRASDGLDLHTYECGRDNPEHLLLVTPIGAPFLLISKLATALGRHFHVLGWDNRGPGYLDEDCSRQCVDVNRHALDLQEILAQRNITSFHVVGWCAGANIVSWLTERLAVTPKTGFFIAPSNIGASKTETQFNSVFVPTLRSLAACDGRKAEFMFKTIRNVVAGAEAHTVDQQVIKRLTSLNFASLETTRRYARLLCEFSAANDEISSFIPFFDALCSRIPSALLHCMDDDVVSWMSSVDAVGRSKRSKLIVLPTGGHYVAYSAGEQVAAEVTAFITATA